jgi:hypothetical protein
VIGLALGVVLVFVYFVLFASLWEASDAPTWLYFLGIWVDNCAVVCRASDVAGRRRDLKSPATS